MTLQQITNLTPEELRIKCAESEDYVGCQRCTDPECYANQLPELTLDTCHRREMELTDEEGNFFITHLAKLLTTSKDAGSWEIMKKSISADAITRSRAWLAAKLGV